MTLFVCAINIQNLLYLYLNNLYIVCTQVVKGEIVHFLLRFVSFCFILSFCIILKVNIFFSLKIRIVVHRLDRRCAPKGEFVSLPSGEEKGDFGVCAKKGVCSYLIFIISKKISS